MMKVFSVGGSVRDQFMGLVPNDHDYVVVGATPAEMLSKGFKQVGKDFPVFLHPETGEEYALARFERKTGVKHTDFETSFEPTVTIEEDLRRRDLTINAIAMSETGEIVDPFKGVEDIHNKVIRHVSEAFAEDPLRILRVARFKARFPEFEVHYSTSLLMRKMMEEGALDHISKDRIWAETKKALISKAPWEYFNALPWGAMKYVTNTEHAIGFCEESMKYVCAKTEEFPEERKLLVRAAAFFSYHWLSVLPKYKTDKKLYIKALREAKLPVDVIELATFCGEHGDLMGNMLDFTHQTTAENAVALYDKLNIRIMVQKNPNFLEDMFMIQESFAEYRHEHYMKIKFIMEAYLDTKEALALEAKRFEWRHGEAPTPAEYKELLHKVRLENTDAAIDRHWGGLVMKIVMNGNVISEI